MDETELQEYVDGGVCPDCTGSLFEYDNDVVECEDCGWTVTLEGDDEDDEL